MSFRFRHPYFGPWRTLEYLDESIYKIKDKVRPEQEMNEEKGFAGPGWYENPKEKQ